MREIKFRGQIRKKCEKVNLKGDSIPGRWVYGGVNKFDGERSIIYTIEYGKCSVYSDTVCQYTGLKDKNGVECYEGDVLKCHYFEYVKERRIIGYVEYSFDGYYLKGINKYKGLRKRLGDLTIEVIGNIYDNQELLKGE